MDEQAAANAITVLGLRDELRTITAERDRLRAALGTCPHYGDRCLSPTCAATRRRLEGSEATDG